MPKVSIYNHVFKAVLQVTKKLSPVTSIKMATRAFTEDDVID